MDMGFILNNLNLAFSIMLRIEFRIIMSAAAQLAAIFFGWTADTWGRCAWLGPRGVAWPDLSGEQRSALEALGEALCHRTVEHEVTIKTSALLDFGFRDLEG